MRVVSKISEVRELINSWRREGETIGFVPTMGYLHEGHASLIKKASKECSKVIVSTFVNPIQFGENEDLDKYPRDREMDEKVCNDNGAEVMFIPEVVEMYPNKRLTTIGVKELTNGLCGEKRPGHFDGVTTVVGKLFNIVTPDKAYFGEKDAQQLIVIRKMVEDLNFQIEIVGCPIVREKDGLAKSSRNKYLNKEERQAALVLSTSLYIAKEMISSGIVEASKIEEGIREFINCERLAKIDYIEIVDMDTLEKLEEIKENTLIALAVFIGKTRLIDNMMI
ncbi:MAG: pantoate--beta-alanine ligase [Clostridium sp.]